MKNVSTLYKNICDDILSRIYSPLSKEEVSKFIDEHPSFDSINIISDTLKFMKIENFVATIDKNINILYKIYKNTVFHTVDNKYIKVKEIKNDKINYYDYNLRKYIKEPVTSFMEAWSGIVLIYDESLLTKKGKSNKIFFSKNNLEKYIISLLILIISLISVVENIENTFFIIMSLTGLVVSIFIHKIDNDELIDNKFCSFKGYDILSCDKTIHGNNNKFMGLISWYKVSFTFFSGQLITFYIYENNIIVYYCSLLSLIFVVYSIWYQVLHIKQICTICMIMLIIILFNFVSIVNLNISTNINLVNFVKVFVIYLLSYTISETYFYNKKTKYSIIKKYNKLISTKSIFNEIQSICELYEPVPPSVSLSFGDYKAINQLTIYTSPTCFNCKVIHKEASNLLKFYSSNWSLQIVFAVRPVEGKNFFEQPLEVQVAAYIIYLYNFIDKNKAFSMLEDWYNSDLKNFVINRSEKFDPELAISMAKMHSDWCHSLKIPHTPYYLINNRNMSYFISIENLKFV